MSKLSIFSHIIGSRIFKLLILFLIFVAFIIAGSAYWFNHWVNQPLPMKEPTIIDVKSGDNLTKLSRRLSEKKLLPFPELWVAYAKFTGDTRINIGEYELSPPITPKELLTVFQSDDVISYSVTLVEGKTFKDFMVRLRAQEKLSLTLTGETYDDLLAELDISIDHLEGWFLPETYRFISQSTDRDILLQAHEKMITTLQEEWANRQDNLPYKTPYEALIMASIIEKETGVAYERSEIAGVFVRRLKKGMRLQTDPTVIYGMGDRYQGNIRRKDLREATPYNTYVIDGLPPTPIAMPGREAIHAALNPKEGDSLFFVAKGDGTHQFSATLAEHNRAVQEYQINKRKKNYRSSPAQ